MPVLPWGFGDEDQRKRFEKLSKRHMVTTRYLDEFALSHLELAKGVRNYLERIGWNEFALLRCPTYKEITLEFLSSLDFEYAPFNEDDHGVIKFRVKGNDCQVDLKTINEILRTPSHGPKRYPGGFDPSHAWHILSGSFNFKPCISKATFIEDPAMKYIHRVMAHSIFGRGESTGAISKMELYVMWAMKVGKPINTGFWLISHLQSVANGNSGKICVGGLVTLIAQHFGFDPTSDVSTRVVGNERINLENLVRMNVCVREGDEYFILDSEGKAIQKEAAGTSQRGSEQARQHVQTEDMPEDTPMPEASSSHEASTNELILAELRGLRLQVGQTRDEMKELRAQVGVMHEELRETRSWAQRQLKELQRSSHD